MNAGGGGFVTTSRFRTSVHALVWLATNQCIQSSASLAGHVNSHATFLRRVLLPFVQAGIVEAREGRDGGYLLKIAPEDLTLADIFMTGNAEILCDDDSSDCGEADIKLDKVLEEIAHAAEQQLITVLGQHTLADLLNRLKS